ncbi:MAG: hypothetical protein QOI62_2310 [Solirubrobacteraceae bacterium]|nr:hypothetical protein [Solirubrobacteraceae bacterium]
MQPKMSSTFLGTAVARRALLGAALAGALAATPAAADVGPQGVRSGHNVTVFHNIDMVGVFGHAFGGQTLVEVFRGPHRIASVRGAAISTAEGGGLEINHAPTVTPPLPGECWEGATPDILPGDRIVVSNPGGAAGVDEAIVDDIAIASRRQLTVDPATGQEAVPVPDANDPTATVMPPGSRQEVWVEGAARFGNADGTPGAPIPLERIDSASFIGLPADNQLRVLPSLVDAPNGPGTFRARYFAAPQFNVERNRSGRSNAYILDALTNGDAHAVGYGHGAVLPPVTMMFEGIAPAAGPALGCEAAPAYPSSAGSTSVRALNLATAGVDATDPVLTVGGWAASAVTDADVVLEDADNTSVVAPATLGTDAGEKGWSASFAKADLDGLREGALTARLRIAGTPVGAAKTVLYDLEAPSAPAASPGSGTYEGSQAIGLTTNDPSAVVRYTTNGTDPTPTSAVAPAQLTVSRSQTIKAIAIDRAGNASQVRTFQYTITTPPAPTRGKGADDASGLGGATTVIIQQFLPQSAVAGIRAKPVALRHLTVSKRVRVGRLRSQGLRATVGLDAETELLRYAVYRVRGGRPAGTALTIGYRVPASAAASYRLRLRDRALLRRLKPGRYVLKVTPGRSLSDLGVTRQVGFTVTP